MSNVESRGGEGECVGAHWWRCDGVTEWSEEETFCVCVSV